MTETAKTIRDIIDEQLSEQQRTLDVNTRGIMEENLLIELERSAQRTLWFPGIEPEELALDSSVPGEHQAAISSVVAREIATALHDETEEN